MIAGRSAWLCQGTMPPGSIVSLRKRSWRSLMLAGSFSRSMAASTVSVTPLPAWATGGRTSAWFLPRGHSPAALADKPASVVPAIIPAKTRPRPNSRPLAMRLNMVVVSCVYPRPQRGRTGAQHSSDGQRTEMPIGSGVDSGLLWEEGSSTPDGAGLELLRRHARSDRGNDSRPRLELVAAVLDSVPPRDPVEIGVCGPDLAFVVFEHEEPHRPVEAGIGIGADELRSERRITEDQEHRWMKLDASVGR